MLASDGKYYKTDVADTEQLLRLIQTIPSKKAEPLKLWLAKVGRERIDEIEDFAILTNEITKGWSGKSVKDYKELKKLRKENLRDNMTNLELVLNMLAEATTKEISESEDPSKFDESKEIAK